MLCIVYVSSSAPVLLESLAGGLAAYHPSVKLAHNFADEIYNRTSFFLVGKNSECVSEAALTLCSDAAAQLNYGQHTGSHPTLGTTDHVCLSPLGSQSLESVGAAASALAAKLTCTQGVPVYTYGAASGLRTRLRDIRRSLGYFGKTDAPPVRKDLHAGELPPLKPDYGETLPVDARRGIVCVGAVPLIVNFNMRFRKGDPRSKVIQVTKAVRSTSVEALTLPHENGAFEVACNLLDVKSTPPAMVLETTEKLAGELGIAVDAYYTTGPQESELLDFLEDD